jgi:hypothetical protein
MPRTMARTVAAVLVLSALALPLAAQPEPGKASFPTLLAKLWHRLAAPVVALFTTVDSDGRGGFDPNGLTMDGRSGWDPDGLDSDGRGGWDPNG